MDHTRQLLHACEEGNISVVQSILDKGTDVNSSESEEVTPLQVAAANGQEHIVRLLLMRGATLDKANLVGWTPLLLAARHGHVHVVGLLLQNQADLNAKTKLGANAITLAARGGHLQTCKLLIEAGIDLNPSTGVGSSSCEFTPLMVSSHHGHDAVVRCLLDRGCDISHRTPSMGINALMLGSLNGYMTTSQILIERGADPNLTNVNDHTPLQIAMLKGNREVQGYLDRKTTNKKNKSHPEEIKSDIIEAAKTGDLKRLKEMLDNDITQRDAYSPQDGATPLMFAAMTGRLDMAQFLVEKGCDINKQDAISGWTALMQATYHGKKAVSKYLLSVGADVLIRARNGCTAFDMASLIDDVDTELYRLMAAKAAKVAVTEKKAKGKLAKSNGTWRGSMSVIPDEQGETDERPKSGLKAWLNRMSNRFRNLKMGRSFNNSVNRVAQSPVVAPTTTVVEPLNPEPEETSRSKGKKSSHSPKKSLSAHRLVSSSTSDLSTMNSYDTILLETRKSAALYTLGVNSQSATIKDGNLRPVIPPFLPPPTFEADRPKMPPISTRRSVTSLGSTSTLTQTSTRPIIPPMKLLQNYSASTQNLANSPTSPLPSMKFEGGDSGNSARYSLTDSNRFNHLDSVSKSGQGDDASPSSSAGASGISGTTNKSKGPSSASSSTLTAGSDNFYRSIPESRASDQLFMPVGRGARPPSYPPSSSYHRHHVAFNLNTHISPNSSGSGSSVQTSHKNPRPKSQSSSKDSASTLTPSPSPVPKPADTSDTTPSTVSYNPKDETDPGGILKKLSLERYQPIFEEQEVDMEAFLTLSDQDLTELGISHTDSRKQILTAITELKSGKGRERQHLQDTMSSFQSTMNSFSPEWSEGIGYTDWVVPEEITPVPDTSAKSRAS